MQADAIPIVHRCREIGAIVNAEFAKVVAEYYAALIARGVAPDHACTLARDVQTRLIGENHG